MLCPRTKKRVVPTMQVTLQRMLQKALHKCRLMNRLFLAMIMADIMQVRIMGMEDLQEGLGVEKANGFSIRQIMKSSDSAFQQDTPAQSSSLSKGDLAQQPARRNVVRMAILKALRGQSPPSSSPPIFLATKGRGCAGPRSLQAYTQTHKIAWQLPRLLITSVEGYGWFLIAENEGSGTCSNCFSRQMSLEYSSTTLTNVSSPTMLSISQFIFPYSILSIFPHFGISL